MMKSAEKWRRQNATNGMYCSRRRRVLVDRKVRASLVIVGRVRSQQMAEMPLAEHDNVVKTFPPDRTDRPFTMSVLPRRSRRGWPIPNAHRPKAADEDVTVEGVAVSNDYRGATFQPQASVSWREIHSAVGCAVTPSHRFWRRSCCRISNP